MADNCFQVWHHSVNEFVLFCRRPFLSFLFHRPHCFLALFDYFLFTLLSSHRVYPLLGALRRPILFSAFLLSPSSPHSSLFALLSCSPSLFCLLADNRNPPFFFKFFFALCRSQQTVYLDSSCRVLAWRLLVQQLEIFTRRLN